MFLFLFTSCGQENKNQTTCWLNVQYIDCLNNNLPCECEKSTDSYFSIALDTSLNVDANRITLLNHEQMEPNFYRLKKISDNKYEILMSEDVYKETNIVFIDRDTLYLNTDGVKAKFIKSNLCDGFNINSYYKDNIKFLNKAFVDRDYETLEEILHEDSLMCACNKWLGGLNLITIKGKPDSWTLKMSSDSLFIYKVDNREDPDDPIIEKKLHGYKWIEK